MSFSGERLACVPDPLPDLPGHHYPQPRPITTPLVKQREIIRNEQDMHHTDQELSYIYRYTSSYGLGTHETKQNKACDVVCQSKLPATCRGCFLCVLLPLGEVRYGTGPVVVVDLNQALAMDACS